MFANRRDTIDLILTEALRQRRDQDERLEYVRRVAALFLGISLPATALALSRFEGNLPLVRSIIAWSLLVLGLYATYGVLRPRDWQAGPGIEALINGPYKSGADLHDTRWVLVRSHQEVFAANETQVRRAQRSFISALALLTLSAIVLWSSFVGYREDMTRHTHNEGSGSATQPQIDSPPPSEQSSPPPLPDLPPVAPTLVERGDTEHYRDVARRQRKRTQDRG